jgi:type IV conjugative transfer system pilin TraA
VNKLQALFSKVKTLADRSTTKFVVAFLLMLGVVSFAQASGSDLLASAAAPVKSTFGEGSTMAKWLVLAEVIVGTVMYIKTKNMMLLMGAIVVVVFTAVGFSLAAV